MTAPDTFPTPTASDAGQTSDEATPAPRRALRTSRVASSPIPHIALEVAPCDSCGCAYTVDRLHCVWVEGRDFDWCLPCVTAYRERLEASA